MIKNGSKRTGKNVINEKEGRRSELLKEVTIKNNVFWDLT
jgi:hypothetical protein